MPADISSPKTQVSQALVLWPFFKSSEISPVSTRPEEKRRQPISVTPHLLSIAGSDKYASRLKLTFKALEKLKILLGGYEH